jgi:hypothetical protein
VQLLALLRESDARHTMIFCNTVGGATALAAFLSDHGVRILCLHSNVSSDVRRPCDTRRCCCAVVAADAHTNCIYSWDCAIKLLYVHECVCVCMCVCGEREGHRRGRRD